MHDDNGVGSCRGIGVERDDQCGAESGPTTCARTNGGTEVGLMPAKVSLNIREMVTAGLANEVEEVNQYAAPIQAATAAADEGGRDRCGRGRR